VAQDKLDKGKVKLKNPCEKKRKEKKGKKRKVVEIGEKKITKSVLDSYFS
jgi:hypothetical protein